MPSPGPTIDLDDDQPQGVATQQSPPLRHRPLMPDVNTHHVFHKERLKRSQSETDSDYIIPVKSYCPEDQLWNNSRHFPIAVIGIGCRLPGDVNNTSDFWDVISNGRDTITEIPKDRWSLDMYHSYDNKSGSHVNTRSAFVSDVYGFDNSFFKISPREAAMMDPQQRHLLEVTYDAFMDAGIVPEQIQERCGVYVGIGMMDYPLQLVADKHKMNAYVHTGVAHSVAANRLSYVFNLRGPSMAIDTACASSMTSTHLACKALWDDDCDMAITCGSNILLSPEVTVGFSQLGVLSPEGRCCPFDESAKGYVRGEGWGTVILKPLHNAVRDNDHVYCVITGSVVGDNGNSQSITMPSASAQEELMRSAYSRFGVPLSNVDYVEAHGTGTPIGDPIEAKAISAVFKGRREHPLKIGSGKGNFGHLECAAGIVGIIKTSLMLQKRTLCPNANFKKANPHIDLDDLHLSVQQGLENIPENKRACIGVNSFGFGGALAHMIFEETPFRQEDISIGYGWKIGPSTVNGIPAVVPLSAKSDSALSSLASKWSVVETNSDAQGIIGFISSRRNHFSKRAAFITDSGSEFQNLTANYEDLKSSSPDVITGSAAEQTKLRICMVFPGQGQQWNDMGRQLFKTEAVFRETIQRCDLAFEALSGYSLINRYGVFSETSGGLTASENVINQVEVSQPSILFFQMGIFSLWKHWGVNADVIVGHSLGEVAAAYAGEYISLDDAVAVIYHRSRLQAQFVGKGAMAAYRSSSEEAMKLCQTNKDLYVACINAPTSVTLAGNEETIQAIVESQPTVAKRLRVQCAFHTPHMEPMKDNFLRSTAIQPIIPRDKTVYSTVTGERVLGALDVEYWWNNIRSPVNFLSAVTKILEAENIDMFIECSASPTLMSCVSQTAKHLKQDIPIVVTSCQRQKDDRLCILRSLANVYVNGGDIDWAHVNNNNCQWAPVPSYAWDHADFLEESDVMKKNRLGLFDRTFKGQHGVMSTEMFPYLADHVINGATVFPGAGYIEYALQVYCAESDRPSLENIQFKHVFILEEKASSKLDISLEGSLVQLSSQSGLHAQMKVSLMKSSEAEIALDSIRERCSENVDIKFLYEYFRDIGLQYGKEFQVIKELCVSSGEALALVSCPSNEERAHVTTLDGCFQVALIAAGIRTTTFLPIKIKTFNMLTSIVPSDQQLVAYAKITDHSYDVITADIFLANTDGKLYIEMRGFEAKNISGTTSNVDLHSCLYTTEWQPRASCLPSTQLAREVFDKQYLMNTWPEEMESIGKVEPFIKDIQHLATTYVHHALLAVPKDERHPRNTRYIRRLEQMVQGKTIDIDMIELQSSVAALRQELPEMAVELSMFERLGTLLPDTLKEPSTALSVLFSADALATYFIDSVTTRIYYKAGADVVSRAVKEAAKQKSIIRVLEVGGRMGGLARHMLNACSDLVKQGRLEYVFTDLNTTFFAHARQTLVDYSDVKYRQLDIEQEVSEQGFAPGTFDIVICMDTLHSVVNIQEGLRNMTDLLCENGWMMLYEATQGFFTPEIIFGSLDLCWVYDDNRVDTCWLPQEGWCEEFSRGGLDNIVAVSSPNEFFHSIILGQKPARHLTTATHAVSGGQQERWIIIALDTAAEGVELLRSALKNSVVEIYSTEMIERFKDLLGSDERPTNIIYLWDFEDRTLIKTMKLVQEAYKHNIRSCWIVTYGHTLKAYSSLPAGFARVASNEIHDFPIYSLNICSSPTPSQEFFDKLGNVLIERNASDRELFLDHQNELVPRIVKNDMIQDNIQVAGQWRLEFPPTAKHIDDIHFVEYRTHALTKKEVLVKVNAAAVNFKDVMMTTGLLDELNLTPQFGLECSGVVEDLSPDVTHLEVGDEVIAVSDHCFASHIVSDSDFVVRKPRNLSTTEAAGTAIVFSTAYHALIERARLSQGETVLIHSACGGVGQAAIQVARMVGAHVYCSVGSEAKRQFLRDECGVTHVTDSHSLSFADDILEWTRGEGVDVILNSLSGDFIKRGIEVLKPGGRFCEIGKRDILSNSSLQMQALLENKSFMSVQIDIFMKQQPSAMRRLLERVCSLFEEGSLKPVQTHVRSVADYNETFRWMMTGKHIGKIVLDIGCFTPEKVHHAHQFFKPDATYLVTGGLGGIGQAMVRWMVEKGAKHIAIMTRNGCKTPLHKCTLKYLQRMGATVYEQQFRSDVSSQTDVDKALKTLLAPTPPLKGVFHLAAVIDDVSVVNMTPQHLSRGLKAKAYGAYNLHQCTKHLDLDYFVMMSSVSTACGNPDQASYSAANAYLDALATKRRQEGLPGLSIQIGGVRGAGFLENNLVATKIVQSKGYKLLHIAEYLEMFAKILQQPDTPAVIGLAHMDWETTLQFCHKNMMKFRHLVTSKTELSGSHTITKEDLEGKFITKLSDILYVSADMIDTSRPMIDYGVDSLMAVDMVNWVNKEFGLSISQLDILGGMTTASLLEKALAGEVVISF